MSEIGGLIIIIHFFWGGGGGAEGPYQNFTVVLSHLCGWFIVSFKGDGVYQNVQNNHFGLSLGVLIKSW